MGSVHDIAGLRHLYDVIESNVRSLKSLGVASDSYDGDLLLSVLMSKLPPELRLIASRKFGEADKWNLTDLLETVEAEVQAREQRSLAQSGRENQRLPREPREQPTGATLLAGDANTPKCCF